MGKQNQIDEMARTLTTCERNSCVGRGRACIDYRMAKAIYNAGYRKIPENAVVLTREELAKIHCENIEKISQAQEYTRIETAEKFAERLKEMHDYDERLCDIADEICKELTEEKV